MKNKNHKKIKVAFFIGIFPKISESWFIEQVTSLIDLGIDIDIFAFDKGTDTSEKIRKYGLLERTTYLEFPKSKVKRILLVPGYLLRVLFLRPQALKKIFQYKKYSWKYLFWTAPLVGKMDEYDIVHCHFGMIANRYIIIKDILELYQKFLTTFYGQDSSKYIQAKGISVYDRLKKESSYILTMTEEMSERFVKLGFPAEKLRVNYTGVVPENYHFTERLYKTGETLKAVFVGRFVEKKGIPDLLQAVAILSKTQQNFELHIIGGGSDAKYNESIYRLVEELGIKKYCIFHGMVPHQKTLELFETMHIMVQPSKTASDGDTDDLPFTLLEAQESGLPVITTKHVGIPDGVDDGKSGFLVPEGDYVLVAEKMKFFIEHPEKIREMSIRAHAFMEEKFNLYSIDKQLISLYHSLIK